MDLAMHFDMMDTLFDKLPEYSKYTSTRVYTQEELEDMDIFNVVNGDVNSRIFEDYVEASNEKVAKINAIEIAQPPLDKGVMKVVIAGVPEYIYWKVVDRHERYFRVKIGVYVCVNGIFRFCLMYTVSSDEISEFLKHPWNTDAYDVAASALKKLSPGERKIVSVLLQGKRTNSMKAADKLISTSSLKAFINGMNLFSDLLDEEKEPVESSEEHPQISHGFIKKGDSRRRVIYLNGAKVECGKESNIAIRRGKMVRRTDCWGVRGHYRHYKNGRVVYIAPFEKGVNRNTGRRKGREYRVKEDYNAG